MDLLCVGASIRTTIGAGAGLVAVAWASTEQFAATPQSLKVEEASHNVWADSGVVPNVYAWAHLVPSSVFHPE